MVPLDDSGAPARTPPHLKGLDGARAAWSFLRAEAGWSDILPRTCGDVSLLKVGPLKFHVLASPDAFQRVLVDRLKFYPKSKLLDELKLVTGDGLVTSMGDVWRRQRRIVNPAFHPRSLDQLTPTLIECAEQTSRDLRTLPDGAQVDVAMHMTHVALTMLLRSLFGTSLRRTTEEVHEAVTIAMKEVTRRMTNPLKLPVHWPTRSNRRLAGALQVLHGEIDRVIADRRRAPEDTSDLLGQMMSAVDAEGGAGLSERELRDQCMTMFVAGHDTVAASLTWALHLLGNHPEKAALLREEARAVMGERESLEPEDVSELRYASMVFDEAMRLYPQPAVLFRTAEQDDVIHGFHIPRGATVVLSTSALHQHPDHWPDPKRFEPERFTPEARAGRHRYAYVPFGAGSRACVGKRFASMEAPIVLATLARHMSFENVIEGPVEAEVAAVTQPRGGLPMRVRHA